MRSYTLGNELTFTTTFVDNASGLPVNPSDVVLRFRDPTGTEVDVTPVNPATGVFVGVMTPTLAGRWAYRWEGSGAVVAAREGNFNVNGTDFTPRTTP